MTAEPCEPGSCSSKQFLKGWCWQQLGLRVTRIDAITIKLLLSIVRLSLECLARCIACCSVLLQVQQGWLCEH
jgi:hypothetical protein